MVDLLDIFERDNNSNNRDGAPRRKGLRGLIDRLTGALGMEGDDDDRRDDDRRRRDAATTTTQHGQDNRRRERESFFDDD